jgi:hypothetical protein
MTAVEPPETALFALEHAGSSRKGKVVGILDAVLDFTILWAFDRCTSRAGARVVSGAQAPIRRYEAIAANAVAEVAAGLPQAEPVGEDR